MRVDYIYNGVGTGDVADRLIDSDMDPNVLRPWRGKSGRSYVSVFNGYDGKGQPKFKTQVHNAPASLTKEAWLRIDEAVIRSARPQLRVWGDLVNAGLTYTIPEGMGVTVLQQQNMTDAGSADLSMDGLRETYRDRPEFDLTNLPLPIVHSDFSFSARELAVARRSRMPLDTTMAEQATRKVVEKIEQLTLGSLPTYRYGGGAVYGLTNYPDRITVTITLPTASGWEPNTTINEVLNMIQLLQNDYFNGPYALYVSPGWTKYLDMDYSAAYNGETLRTRLRKIDDVSVIRKVDYLSNYQMILVQLDSSVIRAVTGMRLTTLQWDTNGGLAKKFKIMGIMVPQIRSNTDENTGIVHATAA